jgi:hypothetical protein
MAGIQLRVAAEALVGGYPSALACPGARAEMRSHIGLCPAPFRVRRAAPLEVLNEADGFRSFLPR